MHNPRKSLIFPLKITNSKAVRYRKKNLQGKLAKKIFPEKKHKKPMLHSFFVFFDIFFILFL